MCYTKIFLSIFLSFSDKIFNGIVDVFEETIESFFSFVKYF